MNRFLRLALPVVLALAAPASAQGTCWESFEGGSLPPHWNTIGSTGVTSSTVIAPAPDGTRHAVVVGGNGEWNALLPGLSGTGVSLGEVAAFFGVPPAEFEDLAHDPTAQGSAFAQTVTVSAGDAIEFHWSFFTLEQAAEADDYVVLVITPASSPVTLLANVLSHLRGTPYQTYSHVFPAGGTYTIGFAAFQSFDSSLDSGLLIDLVKFPGSAPDSDGDGAADCIDGCPNDPAKLGPGACGCGVADEPTTYYADIDHDGYGNDASPLAGFGCVVPPGFVAVAGDCNDGNAEIHPGAPEVCNGLDDDCNGLVDDGAPIGAVNYCTAKTNSRGCVPTIGYAGTPSHSAGDFAVTAHDVCNYRTGMLVWGRGSVALPFQGGVLCIDAPRQRTLLQDSGGNVGVEDCSGTFAFEFSPSYMATYSIGIGDQIFAQYWSRDPYSTPYPISLTDGLHFWICP